jgi:hypothetical protein
MTISKVQAYRLDYMSVLKGIVEMHLAIINMCGAKWERVWDEINLMDAVEHAKAELYKRQAEGKFVEYLIRLWRTWSLMSDCFWIRWLMLALYRNLRLRRMVGLKV